MIQLYSWTTPNGRKISIALEEMGLAYQCHSIDIGKGEQFAEKFLKISPNNRIPALVDGGVNLFESGAILIYLAEKTGKFLPEKGTQDYWEALQWLMWQMGGFGPMLGQAHHFLKYNPGKSAYAENRYAKETQRLYEVLELRMKGRSFITSELSIADFSIWPWVSRYEYHGIDLNNFPNILNWYQVLAARPAFQRGYAQPLDVGAIPIPI